jgi:hypothetical protein
MAVEQRRPSASPCSASARRQIRLPRCGSRRGYRLQARAHRPAGADPDCVRRCNTRARASNRRWSAWPRTAAVERLGEDRMNLLARRPCRSGRAARRRARRRSGRNGRSAGTRAPWAARPAAKSPSRWRTIRPRRSGTARRGDRCRGYGQAPCRHGCWARVPARSRTCSTFCRSSGMSLGLRL